MTLILFGVTVSILVGLVRGAVERAAINYGVMGGGIVPTVWGAVLGLLRASWEKPGATRKSILLP